MWNFIHLVRRTHHENEISNVGEEMGEVKGKKIFKHTFFFHSEGASLTTDA